MMKTLLLVLSLTLGFTDVVAQRGFQLRPGSRKMEMSFERHNNLIIIPITLNDQITLRFILDTGVQNAILTEKGYSDLLGLHYDRKINLAGPGSIDSVNALVVKDVKLALPGIVGEHQSLLVLEKDYLNLRNNLGAEVYGIIGYEIFSRFVVELNYDDNKLIFYEPHYFTPKNYYKVLPLSVEGTKPFIQVAITQANGKKVDAKLMVDTGASHAVLLEEDTDPDLVLPEKVLRTSLGRGLGGEIAGDVGRLKTIKLDKFVFKDVLASYPVEGAYNRKRDDGRNGTIGGEILTRFNPVIDYFENKLYLRKSEEHRKTFEHDMAGLEFRAIGKELDQILVTNVLPETPSFRAEMQKGDIITHVNGNRVGTTNFNYINTLFRLKPGKKVKLRVLRGEEELRIDFKLERMI
ncbi:MAG: aspartyl protease family protein [Cyclobacteriaceae bacterium]